MALETAVSSRPRPRRARLAVTIALTLTVVAAVGTLWWSAPREDVADPGPDATPEQVVLAYIEAVNARDFETANRIDARPGEDHGRFSRPMSTHDVEQLGTRMEGETAHVTFTADLDDTDGSLDDGRWGYVLERGADGVWHITDAGVA